MGEKHGDKYKVSGNIEAQYVDAARAALARKDYGPMTEVIRQSLETARNP